VRRDYQIGLSAHRRLGRMFWALQPISWMWDPAAGEGLDAADQHLVY
jgi:hypothetical protein